MYGEGRNWRYIIGFAAVILLLFFIIFLIVNGGRGGNKVPETQKALTSYVDNPDITVSQRVVGPVQAVQTHTEFNIDVTNQTTTASVSTGYDGNITNSKTYPMTPASFSEFLSALDRAGFTKGDTSDKLKDDQGYCPTGQRYIYTIRDAGRVIERFWATSCSGTPKSYKGSVGLTNTLFQAQVPDYNQLSQNTSTGSSFIGL